MAVVDDIAIASDGSVLSSTALVAGNMIGAGVLALPSVTSAPGFWPSSAAMVGVWGYCLLTGLLIAEVSVGAGDDGDEGASMQKMAERTIGPVWGKVFAASFCAANYLLMVAYISQGSTVLSNLPIMSADACGPFLSKCASDLHLPGLAFAGVIGGASLFGPPKAVEKATNLLVGIIVASFGGLMSIGLPQVDMHVLNNHHEAAMLPGMLPVALCALVYQNVVPVVTRQLGGDMPKIRTTLTLGSGLPLLLYILWDAVILGHVAPSIPRDDDSLAAAADVSSSAVDAAAAAAAVSPISALGTNMPVLGLILGAFSFAALVTSFWGASVSLMTECTHAVEDLLGKFNFNFNVDPLRKLDAIFRDLGLSEGGDGGAGGGGGGGGGAKRREGEQGAVPAAAGGGPDGDWAPSAVKALASALVLVPPALVSISCPDAFLGALGYAGKYADPLLYGLVPSVMAWKLRESDPMHKAQVPGGKTLLGGVMALTVGFILWQGAQEGVLAIA